MKCSVRQIFVIDGLFAHGVTFDENLTLSGHYSWNFDDVLFRTLLLRGSAWSAGDAVDRFNNLIKVGVE
jgi:hypothetical protein